MPPIVDSSVQKQPLHFNLVLMLDYQSVGPQCSGLVVLKTAESSHGTRSTSEHEHVDNIHITNLPNLENKTDQRLCQF